jgi:hypothetical protein
LGTVLLVVITAYFWVVFREFANGGNLGHGVGKVPWIGSSDDIVSRAAFVVTLVIPVYTSTHLAWAGILSDGSLYVRLLYGLGPLVVSALVVGIISSHQKIRRGGKDSHESESAPRITYAAREKPSAADA